LRVLLVEDDALLGDGIRVGLQMADYAVDWVRDGEAARLALLNQAYQACVLDLGLPKKDGMAVLKELRGRGNPLPVLILTARDTSADKIAGLDMGADDYLTKPFDLGELQARMRALTRRAAETHASRTTTSPQLCTTVQPPYPRSPVGGVDARRARTPAYAARNRRSQPYRRASTRAPLRQRPPPGPPDSAAPDAA